MANPQDYRVEDSLHDMIVTMQAAYIEWQHGGGAEAAMRWIANTLNGPGLIPDQDEPWGRDAQAYHAAHKSNRFPFCDCGRPSTILWMGKGFCCDAHYQRARDVAIAPGGSGRG